MCNILAVVFVWCLTLIESLKFIAEVYLLFVLKCFDGRCVILVTHLDKIVKGSVIGWPKHYSIVYF